MSAIQEWMNEANRKAHEQLREELAAPSDVTKDMKDADDALTAEIAKRMLVVAKDLGIRPKGLDSGIAIKMQLEAEALEARPALFGLNREAEPFRFSDSFSPAADLAAESTDLERELFYTDPDVIEHVKKNCETPEKYERGLCIAYLRACDLKQPEHTWLNRATRRMIAISLMRSR